MKGKKLIGAVVPYEGDTVRRVDVLREMEVKEDSMGKGVVFSLEFWTKGGEVVFLRRARMCGVKPGVNQSSARVRNVQELDALGAPVGRPKMVSIDLMRCFNGRRVVL